MKFAICGAVTLFHLCRQKGDADATMFSAACPTAFRQRAFTLFQKRRYQDVSFMWARKNPEQARDCLAVPPSTEKVINANSFDNFQDYYERRNWKFSSITDSSELKWAKRLVSHVLSAPLTFSKHYPSRPRQRVCVVGARAEATLPVHYWNEMLLINDRNIESTILEWTLDFCGPETLTTSSNVTLRHEKNKLKLQWTHCGYFHDMQDPKPEWDGFVLYNPGLGHDHLREAWQPTMEYLLSTEKPILLTAHSETDAKRDAQILYEMTGRSIDYQPNAFASCISYEDPYDSTHQVSPNLFVTTIIT